MLPVLRRSSLLLFILLAPVATGCSGADDVPLASDPDWAPGADAGVPTFDATPDAQADTAVIAERPVPRVDAGSQPDEPGLEHSGDLRIGGRTSAVSSSTHEGTLRIGAPQIRGEADLGDGFIRFDPPPHATVGR